MDWAMLELLLQSIGGTWEQAATMVLDLFGGTLASQLTDISAAIAAADRPRVRILAHKLRGGSRQLGAVRLAEDWGVLEEASLQADEPLDAALERARDTYQTTLALLTERLATPPTKG
jgi:HPt (histidine-containing phosphotransfer) domain-containing protein